MLKTNFKKACLIGELQELMVLVAGLHVRLLTGLSLRLVSIVARPTC